MAKLSDIIATADTLKGVANASIENIDDARYVADNVEMWLDQLKREIEDYEEESEE